MVTFFGFEKISDKMCNTLSNVSHHGKHLFEKNHYCKFRILSCSSRQLCFLCFLFYYFAVGLCLDKVSTSAISSNQGLEIRCSGDSCYSKIYSTKKALNDMLESNRHLFREYSEFIDSSSNKVVTEEGLGKLLSDIKIIETAHDHASHEGHDHESHEGHDHESHEGHNHESHEGHDHDSHEEFDPSMYGENRSKTDADYEYFYDLAFGGSDEDSDSNAQNTTQRKKRSMQEMPCISSVEELLKSYIRPNASDNSVQLTLMDLLTLMPQLILNIKRPECRIVEEEIETDEKQTQLSMWKVWLISFGSVALISFVSLIGVLLIPLIKHSMFFHRLISFLVALAVGTLTGDALLHLLPHASGLHDHSSEKGHEGHEGHGDDDEDHFNLMWKGLVACAGIYIFFLLETIMGMIRNKKTCSKEEEDCLASPCTSPTKSDLKLNKDVSSPAQCSPSKSNSPLLSVTIQSNKTTPTCEMSNGTSHFGHDGVKNGKITTPNNECGIAIEEFHVDTGHHHHHSHKVPQSIASLAWMVVLGDGLHNMTDGLAIGAAFTSSIGTGLGTSLAIFFHEIPQELGDFAILLNSGMTVKQALLYNFLSACLCFVGLVIGLLVGEYISGFIYWILALTAGGFLYIALVDMLPTMIKALEHKDYLNRFIIQNIGLLSGFGIMVIIALREDSFNNMF